MGRESRGVRPLGSPMPLTLEDSVVYIFSCCFLWYLYTSFYLSPPKCCSSLVYDRVHWRRETARFGPLPNRPCIGLSVKIGVSCSSSCYLFNYLTFLFSH